MRRGAFFGVARGATGRLPNGETSVEFTLPAAYDIHLTDKKLEAKTAAIQ